MVYTHEMPGGTFEVGTDVYYNSGSYFSAQNTPATKNNAYYVLGARASYLYQPLNLRLTMYGQNITSSKYYVAIQDLDLDTAKVLAQPAEFGAKIQWTFQ